LVRECNGYKGKRFQTKRMLEYKDYFPLYESAGPTKHLTHLEELILTDGKAGATRAIQYLQAMTEVLDSDTESATNVTIKFDGAPAIIFGVDPNGQFFVGSKSIGNKTPKLNYSIDDIKRNHGHAPGLVEKLIQAFVHLKNINFTSVYHGDFLFDEEIKEYTTIDGEEVVAFKPQLILYSFPMDSDEGRVIARAKIGIVLHIEYDIYFDEQGVPRFTTKRFGVDVSNIKTSPDVYLKDAYFDSNAGRVTLTNDETNTVINSINSAQSHLGTIDFEAMPGQLLAELNVYINTEIKQGEFLGDTAVSFQKFVEWISQRYDKKIAGLKSDAGVQRTNKTKEIALANIDKISDDVISLFEFQKVIKQAKDIFIQKYNNMMQGVEMKHYLFDGNGDLVVTNPEGYVAIDVTGNAIKFVDRLEFSRANFAIDKSSKFKKN